jgi:hypothetical protein
MVCVASVSVTFTNPRLTRSHGTGGGTTSDRYEECVTCCVHRKKDGRVASVSVIVHLLYYYAYHM